MAGLSLGRIVASFPRRFKQKATPKRTWLTIQLCCLALVPYILLSLLPMDNKGLYVEILSFLNITMMLSLMIQFPLAARIKRTSLFSKIDWNMQRHKTMGKWIGLFFFLHPLLILFPKWLLSTSDIRLSIVEAITSTRLLTGLIAWVLLFAWVLFAVYRKKFAISYNKWKLLHTAGFMAIVVLSTWHITQVGSHTQMRGNIDLIWWLACLVTLSFTLYGYTLKPRALEKHPGTLISREKINPSHWLIRVKVHNDFTFLPGQFVWLSTNKSAYETDYHPFSIASTQSELPYLSFIVRELGDYTRSLDQLKLGQNVFVDGPYGDMTLAANETTSAISLIASGVGIGPILSLLRSLAKANDPRPIRLIYGNQSWSQMVFSEELKQLEDTMNNFKVYFVCYQASEQAVFYQGYIDRTCLQNALHDLPIEDCSVYLCGSPMAVQNVQQSLQHFPILARNICCEELSF